MDDAWWMPAIEQPKGRLFPLVSERSMPGSLIVNQAGRRFTNESAPYVNFIHDQLRLEEEEGGHIPVWFLMDHRARQRYTFAAVAPYQPLPKSWFAIGTLFSSSTIEGLAEKIGVPPDALAETVGKFNTAARAGRDEEYHRATAPTTATTGPDPSQSLSQRAGESPVLRGQARSGRSGHQRVAF